MCFHIVIHGRAAYARYDDSGKSGYGSFSPRVSFIDPTKFARIGMRTFGEMQSGWVARKWKEYFYGSKTKILTRPHRFQRCGIYTGAINLRVSLTACIIDRRLQGTGKRDIYIEYKYISCAKSLSLKIFIVILITTVLNSWIGVNISLGKISRDTIARRYSLTLSCNIGYWRIIVMQACCYLSVGCYQILHVVFAMQRMRKVMNITWASPVPKLKICLRY